MNVRYRVEIEEEERVELCALVAGGKTALRRMKRAQMLLAANEGCSDDEIATAVHAGTSWQAAEKGT